MLGSCKVHRAYPDCEKLIHTPSMAKPVAVFDATSVVFVRRAFWLNLSVLLTESISFFATVQ
ncbi:hypothetical protein CRN84_10475 [Budvicia aquatica]|uniref:Uncharacterized protein n=1 Tax=Budvicia aquatica TaxID=82979 RepID=A0A2C6DLN9_9GAMM|nr:hypothetical protein CRN84_10475 [Budvicia aquatica]